MCEQAEELRGIIARQSAEIENVRAINRLQADVLAEERDRNRKLTAALKAARNEG
jgi:hypothetical protein